MLCSWHTEQATLQQFYMTIAWHETQTNYACLYQHTYVRGRLKPAAYTAEAAGDNSSQPSLASRRTVGTSSAHSSDSSAGCALPGGGDGAEVAPDRGGFHASMASQIHKSIASQKKYAVRRFGASSAPG